MWSRVVDNLVAQPRFAGSWAGATHTGLAGTPGEGPHLRLWLDVEDGRVTRAGYHTYGCPAAIACGEMLCLLVQGRMCAWAQTLTEQDVTQALGGLPEGKEHVPRLALDALRQALVGATAGQATGGEPTPATASKPRGSDAASDAMSVEGDRV